MGNYFFEWCVWIGYAVAGFAHAPIGLIALAPPAIILGSIFGVTGIPAGWRVIEHRPLAGPKSVLIAEAV